MGETIAGARCPRHPGARAGWRCRSCGAPLCPGCTYVGRTGTTEYPACTRCRGLADPIRVPRAELQPFASRLLHALRYPLSKGALLAVLGAATVVSLLSYVPLIGGILALGVWWGFLFAVIRQSAEGATDFQPPDFSDPFADLVLPAFRGVVATSFVWIPALIRAGSLAANGASLLAVATDPLLWLLVLAGVLYVPAAVMNAAWGGGLGALSPIRAIAGAIRLGGDYLLAVAAVGAVVVAQALLSVSLPGVVAGLPVVGGILQGAVGLVGWTMAAHVLGILLHVRGDAVGLGTPGDYLEPVLGAAVPRAAEPVLATTVAPAPAASPAPAVEAAPAPAVEPDPAPAPVELPVENPASAAEVVAAVEAGDLARAAALHAALPAGGAPLPPRILFQVARGASTAGDHAAAARALHAAATGGDPTVAPDALLVLGRIYAARFGRTEDAKAVFAHLLERYPASAAAQHARAALLKTA